MPKKRYYVTRTAIGVMIIDRRSKSWTLMSGRTVLDYGTCAGRPEFIHYLPGRVVESRGSRAEREE
jgi:hypothetical protein